MQAAEAIADRLVDQPIVLGGGLLAHPTQQADALHVLWCFLLARWRASAERTQPVNGTKLELSSLIGQRDV
jgi:hypothetical protein